MCIHTLIEGLGYFLISNAESYHIPCPATRESAVGLRHALLRHTGDLQPCVYLCVSVFLLTFTSIHTRLYTDERPRRPARRQQPHRLRQQQQQPHQPLLRRLRSLNAHRQCASIIDVCTHCTHHTITHKTEYGNAAAPRFLDVTIASHAARVRSCLSPLASWNTLAPTKH